MLHVRLVHSLVIVNDLNDFVTAFLNVLCTIRLLYGVFFHSLVDAFQLFFWLVDQVVHRLLVLLCGLIDQVGQR